VRGPVGGEKGCGEKKMGNDNARCFLKRHGDMEQGGYGWGGCQVEGQGEVFGRLATTERGGGGRWSGDA
jgi:hypothetical protein